MPATAPSVQSPPGETMYRAPEVLALAGITPKQLDYWVRCNHLHPTNDNPSRHGRGSAPGSGYARLWPAVEVTVARVMGVLVRAGMSVHMAAQVARGYAETGDRRVELGGGVVVLLPPADSLAEVAHG